MGQELKPSISSRYVKSYTSFSGHDMVCVFEMPLPSGGAISKVVGSLQSVTYSTNNNKTPVRNLGDMNARGYVVGPRTIAGTLIFTVFDRHWLREMIAEFSRKERIRVRPLADEIPPLNITISMANEYGDKARLALYKVTFVNEGQVMSINDLYTENTFQFYALDIDYLAPVNDACSNSSTYIPWRGYTYIAPDPTGERNKIIDIAEIPISREIETENRSVKDVLNEVLRANIYEFKPSLYDNKPDKPALTYRDYRDILELELKVRDESQAAQAINKVVPSNWDEKGLVFATRQELKKQRYAMIEKVQAYLKEKLEKERIEKAEKEKEKEVAKK